MKAPCITIPPRPRRDELPPGNGTLQGRHDLSGPLATNCLLRRRKYKIPWLSVGPVMKTKCTLEEKEKE